MIDLPAAVSATDAIPPAIRYRIRNALARLPRAGHDLDSTKCQQWRRLLDASAPWLGAAQDLAEVGYWMIRADQSVELRRFGCDWLSHFPTMVTVERLAGLAHDSATPYPVRERAIRALGDRELRARHRTTLWEPAAVQRADDALVGLADQATRAGRIDSAELPGALRHVQWEGASAMYARAPGLWGSALECFGSPALARVLLVCLADIAPSHRLRALRLSAAVLGQEAVALVRAHANRTSDCEKLETLFLVIALAGEAELAVFEDAIKDVPRAESLRQRARWHLQNPGVIPTIRGLRIARSTAVIPVSERVDQCGRAADDLKAVTTFARHSEPYLYELWGWMVRGSADPARAGELVAAHPRSLHDVRDLFLEDLARRGRVRQLTTAAQASDSADVGAMYLAMWGKPLAALELAATARRYTPELVFARALACYRAGRPDLAQQIVSDDVPPAEIVEEGAPPPFPGPHERWMIEHAPGERLALAAVMGGLSAVLAHAKQAPLDSDSDTPALGAMAAIADHVRRNVTGAAEYPAMPIASDGRLDSALAAECAGTWLLPAPAVARFKPYRIAILLPEVKLDGPDAVHERETALLLWTLCIEACQRHPQLSPLAPDATPLISQDGHLTPLQLDDAFYIASRRHELLWLELCMGASSSVIRLHARGRGADRQSFEGSGRNIGEQIRNAFSAWVSARGLESFGAVFDAGTADDLLAAVRVIAPSLIECARAASIAGYRGAVPRPAIDRLPQGFRASALRLLELGASGNFIAELLATDPEHPHALLAQWQSGAEGSRDIALLLRAMVGAPGWYRPYQVLASNRDAHGTGTEALSALAAAAAAGMAAVCRPDSIEVLEAAADWLVRTDRGWEAIRLFERCVRLHGGDPRAHLAMLRIKESGDRLGARLAQATISSSQHGCPESEPWYADQIEVDLRASSALMAVGRIDDAIALRASRLSGRESSWPGQARLLERWRHEPRFVAQSYARGAHFRGDVAAALEGFLRAEPSDSADLAMFVDALIALGREDEAVLAWAQWGLGHGFHGPIARLAAVHALAAAGHYRLALQELWRVELAAAGRDDIAALGRAGIAMTDAPLDAIEPAVAAQLAIGALTLARRMARTVADYVAAAAFSDVIGRALGKRTAIEFDMTWLAGFSASEPELNRPFAAAEKIDQVFAALGAMRTERASDEDVAAERMRGDRLVAEWLDVVLAQAQSHDSGMLAQAAAYTAAQAIGRYLAATTFPPNPIAGALRTVAGEALALVRTLRASLTDRDAHAVLATIEPLLRRVDRWVAAAWLAAVERSLGIDERAAGNLVGFAQDLPTVAARILGPEETALLSWSVACLHYQRREGWAAKLGAQAGRLAMHTGCLGLDEWAEAIEAQLAAHEIELDDAVDALYTACYLAEGVTAVPCIFAARTLFNADRAQAAFDVLTAGFGAPVGRNGEWRAQQIETLRAAWERSTLELPFDLSGGTGQLFATLRNRDPMHAERLGRWAVAYDPSDTEAHRNLGLSLAAQHKTVEAMHYLVRGARDQAGELLFTALHKAGLLDEAKAVHNYATRWRTTIVTVADDGDPQEPTFVGAQTRHPVYGLLESGAYAEAATKLRDPSWRVRCAALRALRFRQREDNQIAVASRARDAASAILADAIGSSDRQATFARIVALQIREQAHFARDPVPPLGERMTREALDRELRIRSGESISVATLTEPEFVDRVVISNSKIARASDYVALLRDLAQLAPEEALAQFDLDDASYLEVARSWADAMAADPTITHAVEAGLAKR